MDTKIICNLMGLIFKFLKAKKENQLIQTIMIQKSKPLNQKQSLGSTKKKNQIIKIRK
jgi:hypothetical protein